MLGLQTDQVSAAINRLIYTVLTFMVVLGNTDGCSSTISRAITRLYMVAGGATLRSALAVETVISFCRAMHAETNHCT